MLHQIKALKHKCFKAFSFAGHVFSPYGPEEVKGWKGACNNSARCSDCPGDEMEMAYVCGFIPVTMKRCQTGSIVSSGNKGAFQKYLLESSLSRKRKWSHVNDETGFFSQEQISPGVIWKSGWGRGTAVCRNREYCRGDLSLSLSKRWRNSYSSCLSGRRREGGRLSQGEILLKSKL